MINIHNDLYNKHLIDPLTNITPGLEALVRFAEQLRSGKKIELAKIRSIADAHFNQLEAEKLCLDSKMPVLWYFSEMCKDSSPFYHYIKVHGKVFKSYVHTSCAELAEAISSRRLLDMPQVVNAPVVVLPRDLIKTIKAKNVSKAPLYFYIQKFSDEKVPLTVEQQALADFFLEDP